MKIKKVLLCLAISGLLFACGGSNNSSTDETTSEFVDENSNAESDSSISDNMTVDEIFSKYEDLAAQCKELSKRAKDGDKSSVKELKNLVAEAGKLYTKLDNAKGDLTEQQALKLTQLYTQFVAYASGMGDVAEDLKEVNAAANEAMDMLNNMPGF